MKLIIGFWIICAVVIAADSRMTSLIVRYRPEAVVSVQGGNVANLKIRLSEMAVATVWIADTCAAPAKESQTISESGEYHIPISSVPGQGRNFCLLSNADGILLSAALN